MSKITDIDNVDWDKIGESMEASGLGQAYATGMWSFEEEDEEAEDGIARYGEYLSRGATAAALWPKVFNDEAALLEEANRLAE